MKGKNLRRGTASHIKHREKRRPQAGADISDFNAGQDKTAPNGTSKPADRLRTDNMQGQIERRDELKKAALLFEQMLGMINGSDLAALPVPAVPLADLLRQCKNSVLQSADRTVPLLIAWPGLPILNPDWWREAALQVHAVTLDTLQTATGTGIDPISFEQLRTEQERIGHRLIVVADALKDTSAICLPDNLRPALLATCHPWHSFLSASREYKTLEAFCARLLLDFDRWPTLPLTFLDPSEQTNPHSYGIELLRLIDGHGKDNKRNTPTKQQQSDYFGGAPSYEKLCNRLGYEPTCIPVIPPEAWKAAQLSKMLAQIPTDFGSPSIAMVSWFLNRVTALPEGTALAEQMQPLAPALDSCLTADAFPEALDRAAGMMRPDDAALLRLLAAAHFHCQEDPLQCLGLVAEALEEAPPHLLAFPQAGALLYLEAGRGLPAIEALLTPLTYTGALSDRALSCLKREIFPDASAKSAMHGQELLLTALTKCSPLPTIDNRRRIMVEIGTTRETVPGQGSTRQLAMLCADLGIDFVTVDMDPANSRRAQRMFRRLGLPFSAITSRGEDYLAAFEGVIDYVYLDAYDFDHGKHSEMRQGRYEQFLGKRINDIDCHQMHLDCAKSLVEKMSSNGLICFDDTWTEDNGDWAAKGTTAMPYLLTNGFELLETRSRAALLKRHL